MTPKMTLGAAIAALALTATAEANAAASVFSNGLAKFCSEYAREGRDDAAALQTCTYALETEAMERRDRAATFVNRGILHLRRKNYGDASGDFNRALRLQPDLGEAYVNRGAVLLAQRRYAEALADINTGLGHGPDEPEKAYYNRALANEGLDDLRAAYLDYHRALEIRPGWDLPQTELRRFTVVSR